MGPQEEPVTQLTEEIKAALPTDLGASTPVGPVKYKTQPVQHNTVVACGHKLEAGHFPRQANCYDCWFALFETTPGGVEHTHALLSSEGAEAVRKMHGSKFLKMFGKYLRSKMTEAYMNSKAEAAPEVGIEIVDIQAEREANVGIR